MATGLDVKLLRMLAAIDRHGTLTRAAGVLGITQSALSHHIKESERRMAVEIFHRVGKRLRFTAIGEELLQAARVVTGEIDRVEGDLALFRQGYGPIVRLGSGAYGCEAWLPDFIAELGRRETRFAIEILHTGLVFPPVNAVIDGQIDIAISAARSPTGGCGASSFSRMSWWRSCPPSTAWRSETIWSPPISARRSSSAIPPSPRRASRTSASSALPAPCPSAGCVPAMWR